MMVFLLDKRPSNPDAKSTCGAIEYCIYLQLLNAQVEIINSTLVPDEKIQKFKKTIATALQFMGSEFFDRNYASLLLFYGELEVYKEEKGTLFRINEVINEEIAHTNSKMIIQRIQKREDKDKLSSECDVLLNSIINEELQSKFIQLLENIELDENLTVHIRSLVVLYRMVTKFIPSNSSEIISISDYKSFHSEGNQLKINNAFVNEYFKNTLLAYKEFISAVQKVSILDIKEDARVEYIKLIFQEYLETLLLLSKFEQFDEFVFEENSVSNFAKDFNALNKKFKDYFNKCLSDYKQAYDSIDREILWKILKNFGLPNKLINMIKLCNTNISSRVKVNNEISSPFTINSGLKQGDAMSPALFNMALESVIRKIPRTETLNPDEGNILLAYADDIVVIGNSQESIQSTVEELMKIGKYIGLTINSGKTKYMMLKRGGGDHNNLQVGNNIFEQVQEFKYLGSTLNNQNNMHGEINIRLDAANRCLYALSTLFKSKLLSRKTKEHLYISYIRPVLTYACATWATTKGDDEKLRLFERKILRKIYGPIFNNAEQKWEIRTNTQLYQLYKREDVVQFIKGARIEWAGHVWRADGSVLKGALTYMIRGKRPRGRPRKRWKDSVKEVLEEIGGDWEQAYNREQWKELVLAAKSLNGS
ncbi:hypothetical protein AGLY_005297 [Aphis glycines]|uniref:Reverse transcriptase domain-containing protein n=1 Tax=Aphis glycines TaxID=307491 RepID=A0A6G0TWB2_APHGL|nr:hypothetical protein AGLY_005297 [Aphis glycines]